MVRMPGFPRTLDKEKPPIHTGPTEMSFSKPQIPVETFYALVHVPGGTIANHAVEEITIQGEKVLGRKIVSDRDNRPGAIARLMVILDRIPR